MISALSYTLLSDNEDGEVDEDLVEYLAGLLSEMELKDETNVEDAITPFLESCGCSEALVKKACKSVCDVMHMDSSSSSNTSTRNMAEVRKLKGIVSMSESDGPTEAEVDANRFLWGTDNKVQKLTNKSTNAHSSINSAKEKRKSRQELEKSRREYEKKVEFLKRQESNDAGKAAVSSMVLPDYSSGKNERDIQVRNVSLSLDNGRCILDSATVKFAYRRRYGLVGKNGIGKTTLLKAIASMEIPDFPRHHRVLHVRQEIRAAGGDISVLNAVLEADVERTSLLEKEKELLETLEKIDSSDDDANDANISIEEKRKKLLQKQQQNQKQDQSSQTDNSQFSQNLTLLDQVYARLAVIGGDGAESRAAMILSGLQFTPSMQSGPTSALSGGWRMRVSLAAALFIEPDLLLLDEPTNHLDLEAVLWLESYLQQYRHSLVVVSHDRGFLNEICTDIIEFKDLKLNYYKGDYDIYVKTSEESVRNSMRIYQAYMDKRAHMMEFIDKFRFNAKRASLVQSRIKAVEKMDAEAPAMVTVEPLWRFSIPNPEPLGRPIISVDDVGFDYDSTSSHYLLQDVNFGIDLDSRIGILGANGAGKSTLLNLIMGHKIQPLKGSISRNGRLRIAYFTQHSADKFNLELSSVENMLYLYQDAVDQEMRNFLGKFHIRGTDALKPMLMLSGGQKSRVAFASLAYQQPHVIVLDEPTNHLDMETIDALVEAISDFKGGLMVVSHDQYFITKTCKELWVVGEGKAARFRGPFAEYKKFTLTKTSKRVAESVKSLSTLNN